MPIQDTFTIKPNSIEQAKVLKAFVEALKIEFEISRSNVDISKTEILANIKKGLVEINKLEKSGKKGTLLKDFLNDL